METIRLVIGISLIIGHMRFALMSTQDERQRDLIEDSVKRLLGVKAGPERDGASRNHHHMPPRYMMDLYERYRSGQDPMQGNTVRSILPMKGITGKADILMFNLTGINTNEQILQSKLYLLKRRKPRSSRKRDATSYRLKIGDLPDMYSPQWIDLSLSRQKPQWHSYDITESVVRCRQGKKKGDYLLGITVEVVRQKGSNKLASFRRIIKPSSQPFVLIFSEDSQNLTSKPTKSSESHGEIGQLIRVKTQRTKNKGAFVHNGYAAARIRRSIDDNPSLHADLQKIYSIIANMSDDGLQTLLSILQARAHNGYEKSKINYINQAFNKTEFTKAIQYYDINDTEYNSLTRTSHQTFYQQNHEYPQRRSKRTVSTTVVHHYSTLPKDASTTNGSTQEIHLVSSKHVYNPNTIPIPRRKSHQDRSSKRRRKKKRRNRKLPLWWTNHENKLHSQDSSKLCQRRSMVVDFSKLGWDDWIISPKTFNAYYCTGGCPFPLIKDARPSNHAAIQSLIHAVGISPNIPTPCCVPSATSSLTLLYFDETGVLMLKNYPNMIVERCACR